MAKSLRQLDVQCNRLTELTGLDGLEGLEELYLANNAIQSVSGLPLLSCETLNTVDLSYNGIQSMDGIELFQALEELWVSRSAVTSFAQLEPLMKLGNLSCLYLEHSPISSDFEYRIRITKMIPSLQQLDAVNVSRPKC